MPTITCPNCDGKFKSKKDLTGRQVRCPRCDAAFVVDDDAEEIVLPRRSAAAPPRATPPKSRPSSRPKTRKTARGKKRKPNSGGGGFPKPLLICLGIALAIGAGWYGLQVLNQGNLPIPGITAEGGAQNAAAGAGGLAGALGLDDTPESLMEEYTDLGQKLQQILSGVTDAQSAQQAVERIGEISAELIDLRQRAALTSPVPKQQLTESLRRFYRDEQLRQSHVERIADRHEDQFPQFPDLGEALASLDLLARSTKSTIEDYLQQLPDPEDEFERIEHERMSILRQICRRVMQIDGPDDMAATARFARQQATALQALADRLNSTTGLSSQSARAKQKYMPFDTSMLTDAQLLVLARQGINTEPIDQAIIDVSTASSNIDFAQPQRSTASSGSGDPRQAAVGGSMRGARGIAPRGPGPGGRAPGGRGFSGGRPSTNTGTAGADEVVIVLKGDVFREASPDRKEMIAIHKLQREVVMAAQKVVEANIQRRGTNSSIRGELVTIRLKFKEGPQALADRLTLGKIESVDVGKREIVVTISPDLVEQVRESLRASE